MRTIREETEFRKKLDGLGISAERMDLLLESICLTVASHPEIFAEVPSTKLRRFRVPPFPNLPQLNVWFIYDDTYVYLLEVDVLEGTAIYEL
jgi:hypothetical protein